jgi:hypothetical protein
MVRLPSFKPGDRVRISSSCPIDPEGVGPVPGDVGRVVAPAVQGDALRCLRVHFDRIRAAWGIPDRYLEHAEQP